MSNKSKKSHELGGLKTSFDARDYVYEVIQETEQVEIPKSIPKEYCSDIFPEVKNQGSNGACVGFAASLMKDLQERRDSKIKEPTSPLFIYNLRKNAPQSGMYVRDAFSILRTYGICKESTFPYNAKKTSKPTKKALKEALNYRITAYARIYTKKSIQEAIMMNGPVIMGSGVYSWDEDFWKKKSKKLGRHVTAIIGWNEDSFVCQNSWGDSWGIEGRFKLPFDEIDNNDLEFWTGVDHITTRGKQLSWWDFFWWRIKHKPLPWILGGVAVLVAGIITALILTG